MAAENEDRRSYISSDDALLAAIMDEPLPDEARADSAFMAEHRSAVADVALLREQLDIIGRALAEPPAPAPEPAPVPVRQPSRVRRRVFAAAFGGLAVAAAASVLVGMGWLLTQTGSGDTASSGGDAAADSKEAASPASGTAFGSPHYLACARLVAEGDVIAVAPVPGTGQERITLSVTRFFQPAKSEDGEVTFVMEEDSVDKGEHILVGIPRDAASPDVWVVGEQDIAPERAWITASLPEARKLTCE
ncbi:hypothetical protein [Streptomyces bicolor]|uniref:hypothetical protein n=1 Tax=Streptomyces bicolor TaxID=66874 RepID=UPI0004E10504|nr:hypothetical protein [Streptomyces bicolor]